jgi:hypothetical protein
MVARLSALVAALIDPDDQRARELTIHGIFCAQYPELFEA